MSAASDSRVSARKNLLTASDRLANDEEFIMGVIARSFKGYPLPSPRESTNANVARHSVKRKRGGEGTGRKRTCEKMRCEIIPDMFGKSCHLMTPAGGDGRWEWTDDTGRLLSKSPRAPAFPFNPLHHAVGSL